VRLPAPVRQPPRLNLSPLIDVIFILLIFVVLVARFVDQERMDVTVPAAEAGRPAEVDALLITITAAGQVAVEERIVAGGELQDVLLEARPRFARAVVVADAALELQAAVDVISAAKLAGFEAVAVATRPPE
jgi:biopolymer transport protein ExbD